LINDDSLAIIIVSLDGSTLMMCYLRFKR